MRLNPPRFIRVGIYVVNILLGPFVIYALEKGWIGEAEVKLWAAEVAAGFTLAGLNVPEPRK